MIFSKKDKKHKRATKQAAATVDAESLLRAREDGSMDVKSFLVAFNKTKIHYSTPFGNHRDGDHRLFALQLDGYKGKENFAFLPVFTSFENASAFYNKAGRAGFMVLEGLLADFLDIVQKINNDRKMVQFGAVIEPDHHYAVLIDPDKVDAVIRLIK